MRVYNCTVRLASKLENEVFKPNVTAPEILILRKIHDNDAVVRIEDAGEWEDHFGKRRVVEYDDNGAPFEKEIDVEYDDAEERGRLIGIYGNALAKPEEMPADAVHRMFGEYGALPSELPELKKARKEAAKVVKKKDNLDRVA